MYGTLQTASDCAVDSAGNVTTGAATAVLVPDSPPTSSRGC